MRTLKMIGLSLLLTSTAVAEPEIRGTATELTQFLNGVPKTVAITGESEVRVPAHRAVLSLRVISENKSLQEAMRANLELRGKIADHLKKLGIPSDRIQASKFSSTPKFGIWGEKAKSYRLENVMRIAVQDDKEFQAVAGAVDQWSDVQFGGVELEYADKEALKGKAISQACDNADERKKVYEEKLGLKLTPAKFSEGGVVQVNVQRQNYGINMRRSYGMAGGMAAASRMATEMPAADEMGGDATAEDAVSSFGELVFVARVTVEYAVQGK